jgi:hypothetical protein
MAPRSPLNLAIASPQAEKTLSARAREIFVICDFCDLPQGRNRLALVAVPVVALATPAG